MWNNQRAGQQHLNQAGHLFKRELRTRAKNCLRKNNWITTRGNKWLGDSQRAGHHQPDWETNQLPQGKTNELETADSIESRTPPARLGDKWIATSRKQMNWRQPESRTPPARLGDKWSVTRGDKWIGASRKAGHHQPDWETNESLGRHKRHQPDLETNELETAKEPDITSVTETAEEPDTTSQTGRQMSCHKARQMNWRQPKPDTTSQIGRQMSCHKGRQMNWRQPKSRTPPARLGNKWVDIRADKWIGDSRRAGHHQPDWETNELI